MAKFAWSLNPNYTHKNTWKDGFKVFITLALKFNLFYFTNKNIAVQWTIFNPPFAQSRQIFGGNHTPRRKKQNKTKNMLTKFTEKCIIV